MPRLAKCLSSIVSAWCRQQVKKNWIVERRSHQIALRMKIVERTVKAHRAKVMQKFRVESVAELVRVAEKSGITPAR